MTRHRLTKQVSLPLLAAALTTGPAAAAAWVLSAVLRLLGLG